MTRDDAVRLALTKARNWRPPHPTHNEGEALAEFGADLIMEAQRLVATRCHEICKRYYGADFGARDAMDDIDREFIHQTVMLAPAADLWGPGGRE